MNCKLCGKEIFGRMNRLKYHLDKIPGHDVNICPLSSLEIIHIANKSILDIARKRDQREELRLELANREARSMGTTSLSRVGKPNPQPHLPQCPQHPHLSLCQGQRLGDNLPFGQ
jgi:hypothetical protein